MDELGGHDFNGLSADFDAAVPVKAQVDEAAPAHFHTLFADRFNRIAAGDQSGLVEQERQRPACRAGGRIFGNADQRRKHARVHAVHSARSVDENGTRVLPNGCLHFFELQLRRIDCVRVAQRNVQKSCAAAAHRLHRNAGQQIGFVQAERCRNLGAVVEYGIHGRRGRFHEQTSIRFTPDANDTGVLVETNRCSPAALQQRVRRTNRRVSRER